MPDVPLMKEDHISQIPALQFLQNLGYTYLTPEEANSSRGGRTGDVILEGILAKQLRCMNTINYRDNQYPFSEGNIMSAIQSLKDIMNDGLIRTNERVYNLLCLGKSLSQSINGDTKSFTLQYIDWEHPERNVYHVAEEFNVGRTGTRQPYTPDIVLFVNGIPLVVIECKSPHSGSENNKPIDQAISQQIRNQKDDGIPQLFFYSQLLLALSKNEAKYGTTGTPAKFWAVWKEADIDNEVSRLINKPLSSDKKTKLFSKRFRYVRDYFDAIEVDGGREITEQDRALYSLCRPDRLLELAFQFIVYDAGEKKIARYQQYFTVKKIAERIRQIDSTGKRKGGVVWHTQGSGKSLTMVMLAKSIALESSINDYKIILVTDRVDLDDQIFTTFKHCGREVVQAKTGKNLMALLSGQKQRIITTVIDKFDAAVGSKGLRIDNPDIFVLVDESHRGQYGPRHARMQKTLPNACYIGFTGTPIMHQHKNTVSKFGGIIPPAYTMRDAVRDKAVVPLLYEGRQVKQMVFKEPIDSWFERITASLTKEQVADLKRKYSTADELNKALQNVMRIALDVSEHFRDNWQNSGFKAQLVTPNKPTALLYKKFLDEFGVVTSEILISGPDEREGEEDIREENTSEVIHFWKTMMDRYGSEKDYNREVINAFKFDDQPEIIIVVSKLLTGFDAPRNTVLYLAKKMEGHSLLQAIARVNRLYDGKDFGYILDYWGVLSELDQALTFYDKLSEYDGEDLDTLAVTSISAEVEKLPQRHSDLWDLFKDIRNTRDEEQYELLLAQEDLREKFYQRFSEFGRTLSIALSTVKFITETSDDKIDLYKRDRDFFARLRVNVQRRYAEVVNFRDYQPQIKKLIDTYVGTGDIEKLNEPVNIFDTDAFEEEVVRQTGDASKADIIAHNTMRSISEHMQEDPVFYKKFSQLLEEAIRAFHQERIIKADEYLKRVRSIMNSVVTRTGDDVPEALRERDVAKAFYGCIKENREKHGIDNDERDIWSEAAIGIEDIIRVHKKVDWETDVDKQNQMRNDIEDYLFDMKDKCGLELTFDDIDVIMEQCLDIAKLRIHQR
ncbi:HsdR family type I site-specific deoxyribonuclease [bacterium]|nr:HsdR family type I site-specific deoxyribonuclease [bacterium]